MITHALCEDHGGPEVTIQDAYCDTCGMWFRWLELHGGGHYDLPVRMAISCLRSCGCDCGRCGGRVLMTVEEEESD